MSASPLQTILVLGACLVVALILLFGFLYLVELLRHRRRTVLRQRAPSAGLRYEAEQSRVPDEVADVLPIIQRAAERTIQHVMRGERDGLRIEAFDYQYVAGQNQNSKTTVGKMFWYAPPGRETYTQTVALIELPGDVLPRFELREYDMLHQKLDPIPRLREIAHEGRMRLPRDYMLSGEDREAVCAVMTAQSIDIIAGDHRLSADGSGRWLAVYRPNEVINADDLAGFVDRAVNVATRLHAAARRAHT